MKKKPTVDDPIGAVALLAEPTRRALYELVTAGSEPVGRDDAVAALGISRELAAFHLDRLVEAGLLETEYRRRSGRTGPGAGRPAKLYRRAGREVEVSLPSRRYDRVADLMATALDRLDGETAKATLAAVARERGIAAGVDARRQAGRRAGHVRTVAGLVEALEDAGYEPRTTTDRTIGLRNCPYDALVADHRELTCGMNLAWAEGLVGGLGVPAVDVELAPEPGRCCVVFHPQASAPDARSRSPDRDPSPD
jgi:predicted ArsR family transcriptional regulator